MAREKRKMPLTREQDVKRQIAAIDVRLTEIELTNAYKWGWLSPWSEWYDLSRQKDYLLARV